MGSIHGFSFLFGRYIPLAYLCAMQASPATGRLPKILVISNYRSTVSARPEAEIFIGLAAAGFDIEVMTYGDSLYAEKFRAAGIEVTDFHPERKFDAAASRFIRERLIKGGHDILHMFNSKAYMNGLRAAKGLPVKIVMYRGTQANIHWYDVALYAKYFHPRVDKIVCNSRSVEDEFNKQSLTDRRSRFVTINKGHRPEWYAGTAPADLSEFKNSPDTFVITCVANARRVKGVKYLLAAMAEIDSVADISLVLVGRGLDTEEFMAAARKSGHGDRIFFTGFREDALSLVKASDAFVMPSIGAESLTKAVVEAMHLGTAPIITNIPGNKYMVEHGQTGLIVPPKNPQALAEAISAMYKKRTWCEEMGQNAAARITEILHTDRTISEYADFYKDLLDGGTGFKTAKTAL